jgi:hypothetical protein
MEKRRKRMCSTCIYRTGEIKRYRVKHPCHENIIDGTVDLNVSCAGSCRRIGMKLIKVPRFYKKKWAGALRFNLINVAIRNFISRGVLKVHKLSRKK